MKQNKLNYWEVMKWILGSALIGTAATLVTCNDRTAGSSEKKQDLETKVVQPAPETEMPKSTIEKTASEIHSTYTIQRRDTLWGISRKYDINYDRLKKANLGINHNRLKIGQVINFPGPRQYSISERGIEFIKKAEGFSPKIYSDLGYPAIGYGHRLRNGENFTEINEAEADSLLRKDINERYGPAVEENVTVPLNQDQYDALCDFVYNAGIGNFENAGALKELNRGNYNDAAERLKKWDKITVKVNGKNKLRKVPGLTERRQKEYDLFLSR